MKIKEGDFDVIKVIKREESLSPLYTIQVPVQNVEDSSDYMYVTKPDNLTDSIFEEQWEFIFSDIPNGENIKKHRRLAGLTQSELANRLFLTAQNVSKWETGKSAPDVNNLCLLAKELGISVDTNTVYQIVKIDDNHYKLQSKAAGTDAWEDVAGSEIIIPESTKVEASETNGNIKVDGEEVKVYDDIFVTDIKTVNALGGIAAGADLNGMSTHEILNTLLFPYVAFVLGSTSRSAAAATLENGATQTLNSASISITKKSKPITSVKLMNGSTVLGEKTGDEVAAGGTITFSDLGITVSKSNNPNLKFTVTDGQTSTDKNVGASTFVYPYYMGECAADAVIDETLIEGLTKKVESKGNKTVTHSCENGRMVIAYPKAHGALKSILDPNNFETIGDYTRSEVSVTGLDGTAQDYYVYVSGAATVSGFKVQYKY
jgi:transcriptional regulator with XRE-family HTH domain